MDEVSGKNALRTQNDVVGNVSHHFMRFHNLIFIG